MDLKTLRDQVIHNITPLRAARNPPPPTLSSLQLVRAYLLDACYSRRAYFFAALTAAPPPSPQLGNGSLSGDVQMLVSDSLGLTESEVHHAAARVSSIPPPSVGACLARSARAALC